MPKGGSGFTKGAGRAAAAIQRGASKEWRLSNPGDYTKEITDLFKSMYRSGIVMVRDSRGGFKDWGGSDAAIDKALAKINALSDRMAQNVEVYNPDAANEYARLRQTWGKPVYVNSREMEEFRRSIRSGDQMLINPRGRRGIASDAANTAAEGGYRGGNNNVDILSRANREMNATRAAIWSRASDQATRDHYASEIYNELMHRYERTERGAWRRRRR